jgi:hypothetical protein
MKRTLAALFLAFALAGCALVPGSDRSILIGGTSLTAPVSLIDDTTQAGIETAYGAAVTAAVAYRNLPRCPRGTSATVQNPCSTRTAILTLQAADRKAYVALTALRRVNRAGGINALDALRYAREALSEFRALLATHGASA